MTIPSDSRDERIRNIPRWARVIDYLVFGLLAVLVYIILFGGFRLSYWGVLLRVTNPVRLFWEIGLLAVVRHLFCRAPNVLEHATALGTRLSQRPAILWNRRPAWVRDAAPVVAVAVSTRVAVLAIGLMAVVAVGYPPGAPAWTSSDDPLGNLPARWDSGWYLSIALHGYTWDPNLRGEQNLVFFPAYPMAMRLLSYALSGGAPDPATTLWAGVIVSVFAFIPALIYLYFLARDQIGADGALAACALLATYPFAVFYSGAYTESLFLLAIVGAFYHFTHGQLWGAAGWGVLAGLTRPNGWTLSASFALMALPALGGILTSMSRLLPRADRSSTAGILDRRGPMPLVLAASAPVAGLLMYCAFNYWFTGHPLTWARLMTYWERDFNGIAMLEGNVHDLGSLGVIGYLKSKPIDALNMFGLGFGLLTVWPVARRLGLAYGFFVLLCTALPATSGGLVSIGRYSAVLFPSFIWLSGVSSKRSRMLIIALFALFQGLAATLFFTWRAVY